MSDRYILNERGEPVKEDGLRSWADWMSTADRKVARHAADGVIVSTVFLGLDHALEGTSPLLWETMVFGGALDQEMDRCSGSREQAEAMHADMCLRVMAARTLA